MTRRAYYWKRPDRLSWIPNRKTFERQTVRHLANVVRIWPKNRFQLSFFFSFFFFFEEKLFSNTFEQPWRTTINPRNDHFPSFFSRTPNEVSRFRIFLGTRVSTLRHETKLFLHFEEIFSIFRGIPALVRDQLSRILNFFDARILGSSFSSIQRALTRNFVEFRCGDPTAGGKRNESRDNGFASVWIMQSARTNRWVRMPRARLEKRGANIAACTWPKWLQRFLCPSFYPASSLFRG